MNLRADCSAAAAHWLKSCCNIVVWDTAEKGIAEVMNFKRNIIQSKLALQPHEVPQAVILNNAAPCLIPSSVQDMQISVLTWALHDNMQSAAATISPVFTYSKGKLHIEESKFINQLTRGNHNLDTFFTVNFKEQADVRDLRPMVYPGRLVFPSPLGDPSKNMFFGCLLRTQRRTKDIAQLMTKNVLEVEDGQQSQQNTYN